MPLSPTLGGWLWSLRMGGVLWAPLPHMYDILTEPILVIKPQDRWGLVSPLPHMYDIIDRAHLAKISCRYSEMMWVQACKPQHEVGILHDSFSSSGFSILPAPFPCSLSFEGSDINTFMTQHKIVNSSYQRDLLLRTETTAHCKRNRLWWKLIAALIPKHKHSCSEGNLTGTACSFSKYRQ